MVWNFITFSVYRVLFRLSKATLRSTSQNKPNSKTSAHSNMVHESSPLYLNGVSNFCLFKFGLRLLPHHIYDLFIFLTGECYPSALVLLNCFSFFPPFMRTSFTIYLDFFSWYLLFWSSRAVRCVLKRKI